MNPHKRKIIDGKLTCSICNEIKLFGEFRIDSRLDSGRTGACSACLRGREREEYKNRSEEDKIKMYEAQKRCRVANRQKYNKKRYEWRIKKQYGLSLEDYNKMLVSQNNRCAICNKESKLVVDHCHKTKLVRGLLCKTCNQGIGLLRDDTKYLLNAVEYIQKAHLTNINKYFGI